MRFVARGLALMATSAGAVFGQARSGVVRLADGDIPYDIQGRGPAVVLIHGWTQNMSIWDDQVPVFAPKYRVIRYDVRGFGRSTGYADQTANASDLAALLDSLRVPSATLVGLSMGSDIALNFAVNYPQRVRALVLYGAPPTQDFPVAPAPEFMAQFQSFGEIAKKQGLDSLRKALVASDLAWMPPNRPDVAPKLAKAWEGYTARDLTDPRPPSKRVPPTRLAQLNDVRVPVLVIHGDHELAWFRQFDDTLMARLPRAKRVIIANGGHGAHFAQPDEFNRAVLQFLGTVPR
jgi:pimeloyl-ACP methyl ester carboxylesterase